VSTADASLALLVEIVLSGTGLVLTPAFNNEPAEALMVMGLAIVAYSERDEAFVVAATAEGRERVEHMLMMLRRYQAGHRIGLESYASLIKADLLVEVETSYGRRPRLTATGKALLATPQDTGSSGYWDGGP
jgi:hypothetical protein